MKKRLFTFGCSFTHYAWPTWAEAIAASYFEECYNYGRAGGGNRYISEKIVECHIKNNITSDDVVIIEWTSFNRIDLCLPQKTSVSSTLYNDDWETPGFFEAYPLEFRRDFTSMKDLLLKNLTYISLVDGFLNNIGCEYHMISMLSLQETVEWYRNRNDCDFGDIDLSKYHVLEKIKPSYYSYFGSYNYKKNIGDLYYRIDFHPLPDEHVEYISHVLPEYKIKDEIVQKFQSFTEEIHHYANHNYDRWNLRSDLARLFDDFKHMYHDEIFKCMVSLYPSDRHDIDK